MVWSQYGYDLLRTKLMCYQCIYREATIAWRIAKPVNAVFVCPTTSHLQHGIELLCNLIAPPTQRPPHAPHAMSSLLDKSCHPESRCSSEKRHRDPRVDLRALAFVSATQSNDCARRIHSLSSPNREHGPPEWLFAYPSVRPQHTLRSCLAKRTRFYYASLTSSATIMQRYHRSTSMETVLHILSPHSCPRTRARCTRNRVHRHLENSPLQYLAGDRASPPCCARPASLRIGGPASLPSTPADRGDQARDCVALWRNAGCGMPNVRRSPLSPWLNAERRASFD